MGPCLLLPPLWPKLSRLILGGLEASSPLPDSSLTHPFMFDYKSVFLISVGFNLSQEARPVPCLARSFLNFPFVGRRLALTTYFIYLLLV